MSASSWRTAQIDFSGGVGQFGIEERRPGGVAMFELLHHAGVGTVDPEVAEFFGGRMKAVDVEVVASRRASRRGARGWRPD